MVVWDIDSGRVFASLSSPLSFAGSEAPIIAPERAHIAGLSRDAVRILRTSDGAEQRSWRLTPYDRVLGWTDAEHLLVRGWASVRLLLDAIRRVDLLLNLTFNRCTSAAS